MHEIGKIPGPTLMGCYDSFVGAAPSPAKRPTAAIKKLPAGGSSNLPSATIYGPAKKPKPSTVTKSHAAVIKATKATAAKAVNSAMNALRAAQAKPQPKSLKPGQKLTHVGAVVPTTPAPLTPKAKAALEKQKSAVLKSAAAAKKARDAGMLAKKAVIDLAKKAVNQKAISVQIRRKKSGQTRVRGIDLISGNTEIGQEIAALLDSHYDSVGAEPDLNNPGFLTDGSQDPAYWPVDPGAAAAASGDPLAGVDMNALSGVDPLEQDPGPPLPPDAHIPDMNTVGGIPYDGSKGHPPGYIGSKSYFYQTIVNQKYPERRYGFVFGGDPHNPEWPGNNFDKWVWVHGKKGDSGSIPDFPGQEPGVSGWWDNADTINPSYADTANVAKASLAKGYGVLMGNPAFPDFTGMRIDDAGNMFWLPNEAPDWLTAPLKLAAELTAKAEREAKAAAAAADKAAMDKVQSDAALAQAQQDAANALAESQAASEQTIAQAQQATQVQQMDIDQAKAEQQAQVQQQQQDVQAQQILAQQAQQNLEQQRSTQQQQQQVQQMLLEKARREEAYLAEHPEEEFAPQAEDQGGDEEYADSDESQYDEGDGGDFEE